MTGELNPPVQRMLGSGVVSASEGSARIAWDWLDAYLGGAALPLSSEMAAKKAWGQKLILGLTGNIATGKSTVLSVLESLGGKIIDADALVHELREPGKPGHAALVQLFGTEVLQSDGRVNVSNLSARAFADSTVLRQLEQLFRPLVVAECERITRASSARVVVIEAIKLLEGDLKDRVDSVWVVDAPRKVQIERLITDRGMSEAQAVLRVDAQNSQAEKIAQADVLITNAGDLDETRLQVYHAWGKVLRQLWQVGWLDRELVLRWLAAVLGMDLNASEFRRAVDGLTQLARSHETVSLQVLSAWLTEQSGPAKEA